MKDRRIDELELEDKRITCVDCHEEFLFLTGEQRFFMSKGLTEPKRCPGCREARKATIIRQER